MNDPGEIRLHEYHPPADLRVFRFSPGSILRADHSTLVVEVAHEGMLLRHHAFADRWFTITTTTDLSGAFVETSGPTTPPFAFNCDISTPFVRDGDVVSVVDLWLDLLVRADGMTAIVVDEDDFVEARRQGWLSATEAEGAARGLRELQDLIESGRLASFLAAVSPFEPADRPPSTPMERADPKQFPTLHPGRRPSW